MLQEESEGGILLGLLHVASSILKDQLNDDLTVSTLSNCKAMAIGMILEQNQNAYIHTNLNNAE